MNPDVDNIVPNTEGAASSYYGATSGDYSKESLDQLKGLTIRMRPTVVVLSLYLSPFSFLRIISLFEVPTLPLLLLLLFVLPFFLFSLLYC